MIKRITLTEEHIKLISLIRFEEDEENNTLFIDIDSPYELSGRLQDLALVLGYKDKAIPGTEEDPEGAAFPDDVEDHLLEVHHYVTKNLYYIETMVHQLAFKGGITPGTYKCIDTEGIWSKED
jgi:hypothetical protein